MSIPKLSKNHPTVAELALLERQGTGARPLIAAMSNEVLAELDDRLGLALTTLREAHMHDARIDDLGALAAVVRCTLRHRRAEAALDSVLRYTPR